MARISCFNIPSLPLQIALQRYPPGQIPVALVKDDRPSSPLLQLNREARRQGLRPTMRYGEALALVPDLKAEVVSHTDLEEAEKEIFRVLSRWSPSIEPCPIERGTFWLDPCGLSGLFGTEVQWARSVVSALGTRRYRAHFAIGSSRGGTFVLARTQQESLTKSATEERRAWNLASLALLPLSPTDRRRMKRLGIRSLGDLAKLNPAELLRRFDPALVSVLNEMSTTDNLPLQPIALERPKLVRCRFEPAESQVERMLQAIVTLLEPELERLRHRGQLMSELKLLFVAESSLEPEVLRPATPSSELKLWKRFLNLRLAEKEFSSAITEVRLLWSEAPLPSVSEDLFLVPDRDLKKGEQALALIRAKWGNACVLHAVPADSHVPELSFRWEPVEKLSPPNPQEPQAKASVRRLFRSPQPGDPAGRPISPPLRLTQTLASVTIDREYFFLRHGRQIVWITKDLKTNETTILGVLD
ncbi:MAG: hypothetical protein HKM05_01000 [Spirochaetales bacterium]|nr:hypothetical protein [Spirochaetales bacterium]